MASKCCVPMCNSLRKKKPAISFHKFPNNLEKISFKNNYGVFESVNKKNLWASKLKIGKKISPYMRVCSLHFNENDFFTVRHRKNLKKNAVPPLNLPQVVQGSSSSAQFSSKTTLASARGERLAMRTKVKEEIGIPISENLCEVEIEDEKIVECLNESEIEAANTSLSLMQTGVENSDQKTLRDFKIQVNMPRKYTLCDFITSDASLTSLTGIRSHQLLSKIV